VRILSVVGARPQFVKAAILSDRLRSNCEEILVHTGQHYDDNMSRVFFDELGIPAPDVYLGIGGGTHGEQTGRMLIEIEKVLLQERPDWTIVYGDTNTTLAGALASAKLRIRVAHVEAGLRSFNKGMPEEINRIACDHMSDALFCPTANAAGHLRNEGITKGVHVVGDVMADILQRSLPHAREKSRILHQLSLEPGSYFLATIHRAANTDNVGNLQSLLIALGSLDRPVLLPIHPRTRGVVQDQQLRIPQNVRAIDPVGYLDMLQLEAHADAIMTDSGGMQKEAYWLGVRCITLRDETEWTETVEAGWNRLVGSDPDLIIAAARDWHPAGERPELYGDGHAAEKIADILLRTAA
jgi:UDP-GlcNAc3NAcA epimerase